MKYYFIVNPNSGKVKKKNIEDKITQACLKREIRYEILHTSYAKEAEKLARQISDDEECVIFSVGGDGSLNETLNGMVHSKNKILSVIPAGSGNDFYKSLSMLDYGVHAIDLGKINDRYFINIACIGLDADVANNLDIFRIKKWVPVSQRYYASLIYTFVKFQFKKLRISMGTNTIKRDCTILAVCNGQYYGSGFHIAPHASLKDGMFDIYMAEKMPKLKMIPLFVKLAKAKHESSPKIKRFEESKIIIASEEAYTCNVDGEMMTSTHFEMEIEKNAVRVFNDKEFVAEILRT